MADVVKFKVLAPYASWSTDEDHVFGADGEHTVEHPSEEFLLAAGHAHAEGVIDVSEGLVTDHVMSFEDWQKAQADAMGEWVPPTYGEDGAAIPGYWTGPWYEGHLQAQADLAAGGGDSSVVIDVPSVEEGVN